MLHIDCMALGLKGSHFGKVSNAPWMNTTSHLAQESVIRSKFHTCPPYTNQKKKAHGASLAGPAFGLQCSPDRPPSFPSAYP